MRFEIARSLNGDKVMYIARDQGGVVRLREETEEKLTEAIKAYNEALARESLPAKPKTKSKESALKETPSASSGEEVKDENEVIAQPDTTPQQTESPNAPQSQTVSEESQPSVNSSRKKFLHSDIKEKIEEKKKTSAKKSFWDKLK